MDISEAIDGYLNDVAKRYEILEKNIEKILDSSKQNFQLETARIAFMHWILIMDIGGVDEVEKEGRLTLLQPEIADYIGIHMGYFIAWCNQSSEYFKNYMFGMKHPSPYDIYIEIYSYLDNSINPKKENTKIVNAMHTMAISIKNTSILESALSQTR